MADTNAASGLTVAQWDDQFFTEYLSENRYAGEMGSNETSIIHVKEDSPRRRGRPRSLRPRQQAHERCHHRLERA